VRLEQRNLDPLTWGDGHGLNIEGGQLSWAGTQLGQDERKPRDDGICQGV